MWSETDGNTESLRMLEAGRVDYAVAGLLLGERVIQTDGLSGKIEPLLSRSVVEQDISVCFAKGIASRPGILCGRLLTRPETIQGDRHVSGDKP